MSLCALKGLGFSRAVKPFPFVIPSRPQPRLRGEDERGICISRLFPQPPRPDALVRSSRAALTRTWSNLCLLFFPLRLLTGNAARAQNGPAATGKLDYSILPSRNGSNKTIGG